MTRVMTENDPYLLLTTTADIGQPGPQLDGFIRIENDVERPIGRFGRVGRVNVFVGPNNAGKSRILRQMFTRQFLALDCEDSEVERLVGLASALADWPAARTFLPELATFLPALFEDPIRLRRGDAQLLRVHDSGELELAPVGRHLGAVRGEGPELRRAEEVIRSFAEPVKIGVVIGDQQPRLFVPTLRSTLRLADSVKLRDDDPEGDTDPFQRTFVDAFGLGRQHYDGRNPRFRVLTGGRMHEDLHKAILGDTHVRQRLDAFQRFVGREFFGQSAQSAVRLVPRVSHSFSDVNGQRSPHLVLELESGGNSLPIQQLGDGVSSLLILLLPLFLQPEGSWIFIEEPENHLHPGLQRRFIEVAHEYGVRQRKHRLFLTTHSNHILEAVREVDGARIFRVERAADGDGGVPRKHVVTEVPHATIEVLDDLGATAASVLQARSVVWVEGPSDVHYLRALLRLAQEAEVQANEASPISRILEGRDFAFVSYGGSVLATLENDQDTSGLHTQLGRILSVGLKSLVIADRDGPDKASLHQRRKHDFERENVRYEVTETLEIENELGATVWSQLLPRIKPRVWKGPVQLTPEDLRAERLGALADRAFNTEYAKTNGGTLPSPEKSRAASQFAEMVREGEIRWEDIAPEGKALAKKVLEFVRAALPKNPAL